MKCFSLLAGALLSLSFLVVGCKSSSSVQRTDIPRPAPGFDLEAYKDRVVAHTTQMQTLTAKASVAIQTGGKSISANGTLRMKRNDVIQLSITFLGMEVGRMEFSPQEVLLIDRFNKQYVRAPYAEVSFLQKADLDFNALQALLWNEVFVPGTPNLTTEAMQRFEAKENGDYVLLDLTDAPELLYQFRTVKGNGLLDNTLIRSKKNDDSTEFTCRYGSFTEVEGKTFPTRIHMAVSGLKKGAYSLDLTLSKLNSSADWETHTDVSTKYKERSVNDILKQLMNL